MANKPWLGSPPRPSTWPFGSTASPSPWGSGRASPASIKPWIRGWSRSGLTPEQSKTLTKYAKDTPEFTFKIGVVEGRVINIKEIEALATMPSKEELMSKLLFLINAPAQRLATVMSQVGRNLAVVVDQGVQTKKFKEA